MSKRQERAALIQSNADLFWFIPGPKKTQISDECLVETILNYGDLDAFRQLVDLMGMNGVARIFSRTVHISERRRHNYNDLCLNYFHKVFERYAPGYPYC
jgi:hypothetical protein